MHGHLISSASIHDDDKSSVPHKTHDGPGRCRRLIGDSQTSYWYLALECFLSEYLVQAPRSPPANTSAANLWLVKFDEWRDLKGSPKASPKPTICALLQVCSRLTIVPSSSAVGNIMQGASVPQPSRRHEPN